MASRWCVGCGKPAKSAGIFGSATPYCASCGWNSGAAREELRFEIRVTTWLFLVAAAFLGYRMWREPELTSALLGILFAFAGCILIVVLAALDHLSLWRGANKRPKVGDSSAAAQEPQAGEALDFAGYFARAASLPTPRKLRIISVGKGIIFMYAIISPFFFVDWASEPLEHAENRYVALTVRAGIVGIATFLLWKRHLHRRLMRHGSLAQGKVTQIRHGVAVGVLPILLFGWNRVGYVFRDASGRVVEGKGKDRSGNLHEDSPVLVFYEPQNPEKNLAEGCSFYELKLPRKLFGG